MIRRSRSILAFLSISLVACGAPQDPKPKGSPVVAVKKDTEAPPAPKTPKVKVEDLESGKGPNGEVATFATRGGIYVTSAGVDRFVEPNELHPPPGERSLLAILPTTLIYLEDGTLVAGVADGTVTALDGGLSRKWSLGFRGAVSGLVITEDGRVAVTTVSGVVALVTGEGKLLWERQITSDALSDVKRGPKGLLLVAGSHGVLAFSPTGELVFSHAENLSDDICCRQDPKEKFSVDASGRVTAKNLDFRIDDPHPPIASIEPSFPLHYEKVLDERAADLVSGGTDELIALVSGKKSYDIVRIRDGKSTRFAVPSRGARAESPLGSDGGKPERPALQMDALLVGPNGNPWILARRVYPPGEWDSPWGARPAKGLILELRGNTVQERSDLQKAFDEHLLDTSSDGRILAAPQGTTNLFCFGEDAACALYEGATLHLLTAPAKVVSIARIGDKNFVATSTKGIFRVDGEAFVPVTYPQSELRPMDVIGGTSDTDRWYAPTSGTLALHDDGKTPSVFTLPFGITGGLVARAADDVWTGDGAGHWDGIRWSEVYGARRGHIVVRGANDIWVGNADGIWHGTAPGPGHVKLPAPRVVDGGALPAPAALPLGASSAGHVVARTSLVVKGGAPITAAKRITAAPDGTLWLETWDRLVEVDDQGKASLLLDDEKRITFDPWFYPEARGRGILLHRERESGADNERDEVRRFESGKSTRADFQLVHNDLAAVSGNGSGAAWIVGTFGSHYPTWARRASALEFQPHALVRADEKGAFEPVLGLPAAFFLSVSVTPDGGAWMAGSLNAGPMGEGILFQARGRKGEGGATRMRAPATLFAVAAFGNDEAWAVGAAGVVMHVREGVVTRYGLASGEWLRAVAGTGPNDVWIGGDGGTLIHYDGREFHPVDHPLGGHAAFTSIAISRGVVWAVSPSGIVRATSRGAGR